MQRNTHPIEAGTSSNDLNFPVQTKTLLSKFDNDVYDCIFGFAAGWASGGVVPDLSADCENIRTVCGVRRVAGLKFCINTRSMFTDN